MDTHDSAHVPSKVTAASCDSKVLDWVQSVGVDHEISIILIDSGRLAAVPSVEELCQSLLLNRMDSVHIEPRRITWEDNGVCLGDKVRAC